MNAWTAWACVNSARYAAAVGCFHVAYLFSRSGTEGGGWLIFAGIVLLLFGAYDVETRKEHGKTEG